MTGGPSKLDRIARANISDLIAMAQAVSAVLAYSLLGVGVVVSIGGTPEVGGDLLTAGVGVGALFFGFVGWGRQRREDHAHQNQARALAWLATVGVIHLGRQRPRDGDVDWAGGKNREAELARLEDMLISLQPLAAHLGEAATEAAASALRWIHMARLDLPYAIDPSLPWQIRHYEILGIEAKLISIVLDLIGVDEFDLEFAGHAKDFVEAREQLRTRAEAALEGRLVPMSTAQLSFTDPKGVNWTALLLHFGNAGPGINPAEHDRPSRAVLRFTCTDGRTLEGDMDVNRWRQVKVADLQLALGAALEGQTREQGAS